ncbi:MAG: hypothetical protein AAGH89_06760 [Verrucomicrobiota bacterium]
MESLWILLIIPLLVCVNFLAAFLFDEDRLRSFFKERNATLLKWSRLPFGQGAISFYRGRLYRISYKDEMQRLHQADVAVSITRGITLYRDKVIEGSPPPIDREELFAEKARLLKRLEEIERIEKSLRSQDQPG